MIWARLAFVCLALCAHAAEWAGSFNGATLYEVFGVSETADAQAIAAAHRIAVKKFRADIDSTHLEEFRFITDVFQILADKDNRKLYDAYLKHARKHALALGTANQQRQFFAKYLNDARHRGRSLDQHAKHLLAYLLKHPVSGFPKQFSPSPAPMRPEVKVEPVAATAQTPEPEPVKAAQATVERVACRKSYSRLLKATGIAAIAGGGVIALKSVLGTHADEISSDNVPVVEDPIPAPAVVPVPVPVAEPEQTPSLPTQRGKKIRDRLK